MGTEFTGRAANAVDNFILSMIGLVLGLPVTHLFPAFGFTPSSIIQAVVSLFIIVGFGVITYYVGTFCLAYATDIVSRAVELPFRAAYCRGVSMSPTLPPGKKVVFGVVKDEYHVGDVISFEVDASYEFVQHRIIEKTSEGYVTKGDNNGETDGVVPHEDVLFKAFSVGPFPFFIPFDMDARIGSLGVFYSFVRWAVSSITLPHERENDSAVERLEADE